MLRNQVIVFKVICLFTLLATVCCAYTGQIRFRYDGILRERNFLNRFSSSNNNFAFELMKTMKTDDNLFFSPFSIYIALAMLNEGARRATSEEIESVLGYKGAGVSRETASSSFRRLLERFQNNHGEEYQLELANALVTVSDYPLSREFLYKMRDYRALVKNANDKDLAVKEINAWVNATTRGKIPKLIKELDDTTVLVILNAVYFKGLWETPFDRSKTTNEIFYNNGVNPVEVPTMIRQGKILYSRNREDGFQVVSLPYKGGDLSMIIVLPLRNFNLSEIELSAENIEHSISKITEEKILLALPKFTMKDSRILNDNLEILGMKKAFTHEADLSGIQNDDKLFVSEVVHKAFIEVNEEGSTAAGSTGVIVNTRIGPLSFICNRPFLFIIRDNKTGMHLFVGQVNQL